MTIFIVTLLILANIACLIYVLSNYKFTAKTEKLRVFTEKELKEYRNDIIKFCINYYDEKYDCYPKGTVVNDLHKIRNHTFTITYKDKTGYVTLPKELLEQLLSTYEREETTQNADSNE